MHVSDKEAASRGKEQERHRQLGWEEREAEHEQSCHAGQKQNGYL